MVRAVAPKNINHATGPLTHVGTWTTQEVVALAGDLPVGGVSGEQIRTLARMVIPVEAGDFLEIDGWQRVTNDIGPVKYTSGAGFFAEVYDMDDGASSTDRVWLRVSSLNGQNVDRSIVHHLPLTLSGANWTVPADWPAGHRAVVCFRADAHSTAWNANGGGDKVTVDDYGVLTVRRWKPAVDDPRWAEVEQRLTALENPTPPEVTPCP
ncbi:MAG TPA: hypothetical protein VFF37_14475 [Streptomyces sp.]|nr:hypothetical protein [Streptomyces sp.]